MAPRKRSIQDYFGNRKRRRWRPRDVPLPYKGYHDEL